MEEGGRGGDSSPRQRAHTVAARPQRDTPTSGGPRTMRDFMELTAKAKKIEGKSMRCGTGDEERWDWGWGEMGLGMGGCGAEWMVIEWVPFSYH